jgi:hypothetical protein
MSPTTSVRAARRPSSKRNRTSAGYLREQQRVRIRQIRLRARKERNLVCKLRAQCATPSARHLLKQVLQTIDLVDQYFLSAEFLPQQRAPAQFAKWFDYVEQCLVNAVKTREFYETMLERYYPTGTGSRAENSSGAHLKAQTTRRSLASSDDKVVDSRPPTATSIAVWSPTEGVWDAGGSSLKPSCAKNRSNGVTRKTQRDPRAGLSFRFRA